MKHLLIIRHAKSDWGERGLEDFDRPLNERGQRNAPEMAKRLIQRNIIPELVVSSPALRAKSTAAYFAEIFGYGQDDIVEEPRIYEASASTLLQLINNWDNRYNSIALVGHNPGLTELAIKLSDFDDPNIPTCGVALLEFPFDDWRMISAGTGEVKMYDYPKNL